jgi:hypothetical protein
VALTTLCTNAVLRGAGAPERQPGCHQQRILGTTTGPLTRFSGASHDVHWRTKPGPGYSIA